MFRVPEYIVLIFMALLTLLENRHSLIDVCVWCVCVCVEGCVECGGGCVYGVGGCVCGVGGAYV